MVTAYMFLYKCLCRLICILLYFSGPKTDPSIGLFCKYWISENSNVHMTMQDTSQEVLHFDSNMPGWASTLKSGQDPTMHVAQTSDTNDAFLGRPVKILTETWQVGSDLHLTFDPWSLFFNNSKVINRVAHFKNLRATLHVKFQLNGSPFYYGRLMASYNPLPNTDQFTQAREFVQQDKIAASQRPKVFLDPTTNQGGELICPFIWPKNTLDIPTSEWDKMGNITIFTLNSLQHANELTDPVTITAYAYCSDYDLSTPTSQLPDTIVPQMANGDEYGIVSGPAHTLANWSGKLSNAPIIGKYARATQMASNAISGIASLFGFSKPRELSLTKQHITADIEFGLTNNPDHSTSLALDSKKEITVDPTVTGAGSEDEMALVPLACKESYLTSFPWSTESFSDTHLFSVRVRPTQGDATIQGTGLIEEIHMTPSSWVSLPFEYWTGSMDFRFQIVCSAYHRGRLRFVWDPDYYSGNDYNVNYSQIVDISNARDIKIRVGWGQTTTYLPVSPVLGTGASQILFPSFSFPAPYTSREDWSNGTLSVFVVNELTTPAASGSTIGINVFTNMTDDFEVAGPTPQYIEQYAALDGDDYNPDPSNPRNPGGNPPPDTGPLDAPGNDGTFPGTELAVKTVNPYSVLFIDTTDIAQVDGQNQPFSTVEYSNLIGVGGDRAFLFKDGANLELFGRGTPTGYAFTSTFQFRNPSSNVREITITNPGGTFTGTLPGSIGATVDIDVDFAFFGDGDWESVALTIDATGAGGRIELNSVSTSMFTYEDDLHYTNADIATNSPDFSVSGNRAENTSGNDAGIIVGPVTSQVGNPGSWIGTVEMELDGINYYNDGTTVGETNATPMRFFWQANGGGTKTTGTKLGTTAVNVLDFYTIVGVAPEMQPVPLDPSFRPEMDGVEEEEHEEVNAPEVETPTMYMGPAVVAGPFNQIHFGEQVSSWRQLLKRATKCYDIAAGGANSLVVDSLILPQYPFDVSTLTSANLTATPNPYNIYRWVSSAYVCERGGYRIKFIDTSTIVDRFCNITSSRIPNTSIAVPSFIDDVNSNVSFAGSSFSRMYLNGSHQVELPWYSNYRFLPSRNTDIRDSPNYIERSFLKSDISYRVNMTGMITYSAAEDYSLSNFLSVPIYAFVEDIP